MKSRVQETKAKHSLPGAQLPHSIETNSHDLGGVPLGDKVVDDSLEDRFQAVRWDHLVSSLSRKLKQPNNLALVRGQKPLE